MDGYIIGDLLRGAQSITDLLSRAEAAEVERKVNADALAISARENAKLLARAEAAEDRAEKAEKERDAAVELIGWIYYEACVSVEHDMRQHLDWLKAKIEEWRGKEEE